MLLQLIALTWLLICQSIEPFLRWGRCVSHFNDGGGAKWRVKVKWRGDSQTGKHCLRHSNDPPTTPLSLFGKQSFSSPPLTEWAEARNSLVYSKIFYLPYPSLGLCCTKQMLLEPVCVCACACVQVQSMPFDLQAHADKWAEKALMCLGCRK